MQLQEQQYMPANAVLDSIDLGHVEQYQNLAFVRLYGADRFREFVLTPDEALETKNFHVTEPEERWHLDVQNGLGTKVFLATGTIFEGDSQNRAVKYPSLIGKHSGVIKLPVNCAEQGQGLIKNAPYTKSETIVIASARSGHVDQHKTWATIHMTQTSLGKINDTRDYASAVREVDLSDYVNAFGAPDDEQVGYIAAMRNNGDVYFYADVFGNHDLYKRLHKRLHHSVAAVAKQLNKEDIRIKEESFAAFLKSAREARLMPLNVDGIGDVYMIEQPVAGTALLHGDEPVQVSLRKDVYRAHQSHSPNHTMIISRDDLN